VSSFSHFVPLKNKFYYNYSLRGKLSFPKQQPFPQTVGLGYRNDFVRGYELYVIDGQDYAIFKNNLKRELFKKDFKLPDFMPQQFGKVPAAFYLNFFTDFGYVRNYQPEWSNSTLGNKTLIGYGLGLDCVTWYNSVLRLNFSRNGIGENKFFFNVAREF
jgi:hemolysin activation/secretion protein